MIICTEYREEVIYDDLTNSYYHCYGIEIHQILAVVNTETGIDTVVYQDEPEYHVISPHGLQLQVLALARLAVDEMHLESRCDQLIRKLQHNYGRQFNIYGEYNRLKNSRRNQDSSSDTFIPQITVKRRIKSS